MKKTKKLLSLLLSLTMAASAFAGLAVTVNAADTSYFNDDFESYTATGAEVQGTTEQNVTLGKLAIHVGARGSGGDGVTTASIGTTALAGNAGKYLTVVSGKYASSGRGVSLALDSTCNVPAFADLGTGVLDISFDAYFVDAVSTIQIFGVTSDTTTGDGSVVNDPYLSVANNKNIPTGEWVTVDLQVDSSKKTNMSIKDTDGKLLDVKSFTAVGTALGKIAFYGGATTVHMDNLSVKKIDATSFADATVTVTDGTEAVAGATVAFDQYTVTTGADGTATTKLPLGSYSMVASKDAYNASAAQTVTAAAGTNTFSATVSKMTYTAVPTTIMLGGGQTFVAAATGDTANKTTAFTVASALDQENVALNLDDCTITWAVYPEGTTTANSAVSIGTDGVVSVSKDFAAAEGDVEAFDVVATVKLGEESGTGITTIYVGNSDVLTYSPTQYVNTNRSDNVSPDTTMVMSKSGNMRIAFNFIPGTITTDKDTAHNTIAFRSKASGNPVLFGLQYNKSGLYVFTTNTLDVSTGKVGNDTNHMAFSKYAKIAEYDDIVKTQAYPVELSITGGSLIAKFEGAYSKMLEFPSEEFTIQYIAMGNYRVGNSGMTVSNLLTSTKLMLDVNSMSVEGDDAFAAIAGKTVTRKYTAKSAVSVDGETFTYSLENNTCGNGVTINASTGELSVTAPVTDGTVDVVATSSVSADKKGSLTVAIHDTAELTPTIEGAKAVTVGEKVTYKVTKIMDEYGDDVTEFYQPTWSIDGVSDTEVPTASFEYTAAEAGTAQIIKAVYDANGALASLVEIEEKTLTAGLNTFDVTAERGTKVMLWSSVDGMVPLTPAEEATADLPDAVAVIGANTGLLTTIKAGDATVVATINGQTFNYEIKVAQYSIVSDTVGATVDISDLVTDSNITGYCVTVADADGVQLAQDVVAVADVAGNAVTVPTVAEGTPAKVEVAPVYEYKDTITTGANGYDILLPDASYDITLTKGTTRRADIWVNNNMIGNNVDQYGEGRSITVPATYTATEVKTTGGVFNIRIEEDRGDTTLTYLKVVKTPEIINRKTHVYVLGDSLVAEYYGDYTNQTGKDYPAPGDARSGWGQMLENFIDDDVTVVNLAESGAYALTLYSGNGAFSGVRASAEKGDYLILECGYNDTEKDGNGVPKGTLEDMINSVEGMIAECRAKGVTPILVTANASGHDYKSDLKKSGTLRTIAEEKGVFIVDLAQMSYDFMSTNYESADVAKMNYNLPIVPSDKYLHTSYVGAMKWASFVAQGIYDYQAADTTMNDGAESLADLKLNTDYTFSFVDTVNQTITCAIDTAGTNK